MNIYREVNIFFTLHNRNGRIGNSVYCSFYLQMNVRVLYHFATAYNNNNSILKIMTITLFTKKLKQQQQHSTLFALLLFGITRTLPLIACMPLWNSPFWYGKHTGGGGEVGCIVYMQIATRHHQNEMNELWKIEINGDMSFVLGGLVALCI